MATLVEIAADRRV